MKPPDVYRDWRVVVGFALLVLGAGNWFVGWQRTQDYHAIIASEADRQPAHADAMSGAFDELNAADADGAVLEPFNREQSRVSYASARMDFYHATFLTGQVLVVLGLILTFVGFIGLIRDDARRAHGHVRPAAQ